MSPECSGVRVEAWYSVYQGGHRAENKASSQACAFTNNEISTSSMLTQIKKTMERMGGPVRVGGGVLQPRELL